MKTPNESVVNLSVMRYSDEKLQEFKVIIEGKIQKLESNLRFLTTSLKSGEHLETSHDRRDANGNVSTETNSPIIKNDEKCLASLKSSLMRIHNKTYGVCHCGKLIPEGRLRSVPHSSECIDCKNIKKECA